MSGHLVLVDGSGYIFRAFHALPRMSRPSDGTPVNAVLGYCKAIMKLRKNFDATHAAVVFDTKSPNFRHAIYSEYKAHRPEIDPDLVPQFPLIHEATKALNLPCISKEGFEADDVIATLTQKAVAKGLKVTIFSTDKDLMQLVNNEHVMLYDSFKDKMLNEAHVIEKFGVSPNLVIDVQSLAGDSSDNIPGVKGIGVKTAALLINEYGSLENLLSRASEIKQNKRRESLINEAHMARLSYKLVTLDKNVPLDDDILDNLSMQEVDTDTLVNFFAEQGFKSLLNNGMPRKSKDAIGFSGGAHLNNIDSNANVNENIFPKQVNYEIVNDMASLHKWIDEIKKAHYVAFDTETTGLDPLQADLVGISLSVSSGHACYIPLKHKSQEQEQDIFAQSSKEEITQLDTKQVLAALFDIWCREDILKIAHNIKFDIHILSNAYANLDMAEPKFSAIEDTMLMSFALHAGLHNHGLDMLAENYLSHNCISYDELTKVGNKRISFDYVEIEKAVNYAAEDADIVMRLWHLLKPQMIERKTLSVYEDIDRNLLKVLMAMEKRGITIDIGKLKELSLSFKKQLEVLESDIYQEAGREFNIASPAQLSEVLFNEQGLASTKKTSKTKSNSTSAKVLEALAEEGHKLPELVLSWRGLAKLKSTYSEALVKQINSKTSRIHTQYMPTGAITGRLSSKEPNLQNIPIRTKEGRQIREAFCTESDYKLISADYSQIELRLLAHIAEEETLKQAFIDGEDVHAITAHNVFNIPMENMDPMMRRAAKAINFGVVYGTSAFGLAQNLGISNTEAKEYIDSWFKKYSAIKEYMNNTIQSARENGFVQTFMGRKIHINDINAKGAARGFAERLAINAPIQGGAADIVKIAMINLYERLQDSDCHMLLQVHDELMFEAPKDKAQSYMELITQEMENAVKISIPLTVEASIGDNWGEIH